MLCLVLIHEMRRTQERKVREKKSATRNMNIVEKEEQGEVKGHKGEEGEEKYGEKKSATK